MWGGTHFCEQNGIPPHSPHPQKNLRWGMKGPGRFPLRAFWRSRARRDQSTWYRQTLQLAPSFSM